MKPDFVLLTEIWSSNSMLLFLRLNHPPLPVLWGLCLHSLTELLCAPPPSLFLPWQTHLLPVNCVHTPTCFGLFLFLFPWRLETVSASFSMQEKVLSLHALFSRGTLDLGVRPREALNKRSRDHLENYKHLTTNLANEDIWRWLFSV